MFNLFFPIFFYGLAFSPCIDIFSKQFIPTSNFNTFNMCKDKYVAIAYYEFTKNPLWVYYKLK